ncbi:transcriptional regulator [Vibrio sp. vnigr-6D03]|uniref:metalloregulator ArsR/SmtB family transcription factor n=1 Tax=Vibrio TaxID=662 RepID=UPI000C328A22|nr:MULTISPECIES: metalloregulator ArsR/SmtB family transcription factor [Vibrio]MDP2573035.1 metalloregulator ArsR/SmtB family transcription factor [Vibrio penaeicida]PKF76351.1 transcriptional regulator [Vibrio sp. vnigr-6D03]
MLPHLFFKMLSDETRLRCLLLLAREGSLCVCELMDALEESQPKISRHLAQLRQSGVLLDERRGQWVYYQISSELPEWLSNVIDGIATSESLKVQYQADIERLNRADRPCQ